MYNSVGCRWWGVGLLSMAGIGRPPMVVGRFVVNCGVSVCCRKKWSVDRRRCGVGRGLRTGGRSVADGGTCTVSITGMNYRHLFNSSVLILIIK